MELHLLNKEELARLYRERLTADFPKGELKPLPAMHRLMDLGRCEPLLATEGGQAVGYALMWRSNAPGCVLLEYFGVVPHLRGSGIGGRILTLLGERYGGLLAEAEAPNSPDPGENALRLRRLAFYGRNGFRLLDYECALFGVRFSCLYRGAEEDDRRLEAVHRGVYAAYFSPEHMERFIQLPLAPGEEVNPAPEWVEEF